MPLEKELAYFNDHREEWISEGREGLWCVVLGSELLGFYESMNEAYAVGAKAHGEGVDFLVKRILPEDPVATIQRVYWPIDEQAQTQ
tara:strand:- start:693 stop:953 length:261 start_codon:yes stop_codon:yes gene_type:complete